MVTAPLDTVKLALAKLAIPLLDVVASSPVMVAVPPEYATSIPSPAATITEPKLDAVDTSAAIKTITLPASPQVGDQVSLVDLAGTFGTYNLTIGRNSLKIMGLAEDMTVSQDNAAIQLVYTGATYAYGNKHILK